MPRNHPTLDATAALDYLRSFHPKAQEKGEAYYREGRVVRLTPLNPGCRWLAEVEGESPYTVELMYEAGEGWEGACSCPMTFSCKHAYAAMRALMDRIGVGAMAQASAELTRLWKGLPEPALPSNPLLERLRPALGRPFNPQESQFLGKLHDLWLRCSHQAPISLYDLQKLGLQFPGSTWDQFRPWPSRPADEDEFWQYIAFLAAERGVEIPQFLRCVTDTKKVAEQIARARWQQEVERWNQTLVNWRLCEGPPESGELEAECLTGLFDLRLRLLPEEAVLEWKRPGEETFARLRPTLARKLADSHERGLAQLPPDAELLWVPFLGRMAMGHQLELDYYLDGDLPVLGRLLRQQGLAPRMVTESGQPLQRESPELAWHLEPPGAEANSHYTLRLIQSNGRPAPQVLCVLPGRPTLYLTVDALHVGPRPLFQGLKLSEPNLIPVPAIETSAGVDFLQRLGVKLPERLQSRIHRIPVAVVIRCRLHAPPHRQYEECLFDVQARSADGMVAETWTGERWFSKNADRRDAGGRPGELIPVYDRGQQALIPALMAPLRARYDYGTYTLSLRVTRRFPQLFHQWLKSVPPGIEVQLDPDLAGFAAEPVAASVRLQVTEAAVDWFDLRVALEVKDATLTPEELKLLLDARGGFVRFKGKGWRRLAFNLTEEEDERLARLGLNPHALTSEPQRLHALQLADESARKLLPPAQAEAIQRRAAELKARVTPPIPAGITAELRPYQVEGYHFLSYLAANRFGGILADDMGLGKTLQTLAWLLGLRAASANPVDGDSKPAGPALVVCPKSVMDNWRTEAARFAPGLRVKVWKAAGLREGFGEVEAADLHVVNYSQLRLVSTELAAVRWFAVVLDEGQYIKNPDSQTAQAARALVAEHRLVLSGTPIENRLLDLWSLLAFAMPGVLGSRAQFQRLYDAQGDPFARRRLSARVRPFLLRRTKGQVAKDLPERVEEDLFCELEGEQKTRYQAELKQARQILLGVKTQKELAEVRFHFLTSLLRLRQICCHPALAGGASKAAGAKMEALMDLLDPLMQEGHKVLVFSQFVELIDLLQPELKDRGWPLFRLTGETENRGKLVEGFQKHKGGAVFLLSLKAGGFGLNLTAASYVVLFDPWWNPAVERQAIDRTHRIGQTQKVIAYRLLIKGSIEEKIRQLQKHKAALAEDILGEERFAAALTIQDLEFLLGEE